MIVIILVVLIMTTTSNVFAEEYDLSDHPIYQNVYTGEYNISAERYSKPAISNQYYLDALNVFFDPTHHYYEFGVSVFDYCDLEQFVKYPKCK